MHCAHCCPRLCRSADSIEAALIDRLTPRTRLVILDSVTSNTALCLPLSRLIRSCRARCACSDAAVAALLESPLDRLRPAYFVDALCWARHGARQALTFCTQAVHHCLRVYRCPGVQVLVDGAHALGQLPVDLQELGADFFVSNCHKWLCAPRGSAILWVKRACQDGFLPLVKSHGHGEGFTSDFIWDGVRHCLLHVLVCQTAHSEPSDRPAQLTPVRAAGCRDYSTYLAVAGALAWWRTHGPDEVRLYCRTLLSEAVAMLTHAWGTQPLAPLDLCAFMACVELPTGLQDATEEVPRQLQVRKSMQHLAAQHSCQRSQRACRSGVGMTRSCKPHTHAHVCCTGVGQSAERNTYVCVQDALYSRGIEVPVKRIGQALYVRISVFAYNTLRDYQTLVDAVLHMASEKLQQARQQPDTPH